MRYFLFFLFLSVGIGGLACSPYFPYNYFYRGEFGNETEPQFAAELRLIAVEQKEALAPYRLLRPGTGSTLDAEKADFLRLVPSGDAEVYLRLAGAVRNGANADWRSVPELPESLRLFLRGWERVRSRKPGEPASEPMEWIMLAEQPERFPDRTVWACYMLGNLAAGRGDREARKRWHELCRKRVADGCPDSAGLGFATLKHEIRNSSGGERIRYAFLEYSLQDEKQRKPGLLYYLLSRETARSGGKTLGRTADPLLREIYAAFFMCSPFDCELFIDAVAEKSPKLKNAARMAYLAIRNGKIEQGRRWLSMVEHEDTLSDWLNAEQARRDGDADRALKYLRSWLARLPQQGVRYFSNYPWDWDDAADSFPALPLLYPKNSSRNVSTEENGVYARIGTVYVEKGDLEQALFYFLRANALMDAAHLAEHVMRTDDLLRYVSAFAATRFQTLLEDSFLFLQNVVSRRLIREGRLAEAVPLMRPNSVRYALLMLYSGELQESANPSLPMDLRSLHLYNAARVAYWKGMELFGFCSSPDFALYDGQFGFDTENRFHYRIQALNMIWQAASMAQDKSLKALYFYSGGIYALRAYPNENPARIADLFYKRLVRECRFLPLAVYCDRRRWFGQKEVRLPVIRTIEPLTSLRQVRRLIRNSVPHSMVPTIFRSLIKPEPERKL